MNDAVGLPAGGLVAGGAGVTFPFWNEGVGFLIGANEVLVAVIGLVVLVLTARKLWLDNQLASRRLRALEREAENPPEDAVGMPGGQVATADPARRLSRPTSG